MSEFSEALTALWREAGEPSCRFIAQGIGTMSHTSVHEGLAGKRVLSPGKARALVEYLGGDWSVLKSLYPEKAERVIVNRPGVLTEILEELRAIRKLLEDKK